MPIYDKYKAFENKLGGMIELLFEFFENNSWNCVLNFLIVACIVFSVF